MGIDYIGSDAATTCHIIALRDPVSGRVTLAHIDTPKALAQLPDMERSLGEGAGYRELYLVGGFDEHSANELTFYVLHYFIKRALAKYLLQMASVSSVNDTVDQHGNHSPIVRSLVCR